MSRQYRHKPMKKWTPRAALTRSRCRIEDAQAALRDLAGVWSDVDDYVCGRVDRLLDDLEILLGDIGSAVEDCIENEKGGGA